MWSKHPSGLNFSTSELSWSARPNHSFDHRRELNLCITTGQELSCAWAGTLEPSPGTQSSEAKYCVRRDMMFGLSFILIQKCNWKSGTPFTLSTAAVTNNCLCSLFGSCGECVIIKLDDAAANNGIVQCVNAHLLWPGVDFEIWALVNLQTI